jgi:hypothetical protein
VKNGKILYFSGNAFNDILATPSENRDKIDRSTSVSSDVIMLLSSINHFSFLINFIPGTNDLYHVLWSFLNQHNVM